MIPRLRRAERVFALALLVASCALVPVGTATADDAEALRASLARDQAALIELIRRPRGDDEPPLADDPAFREIAARLPRTQALLRARGDGETPVPEAPDR